MKLYYYSNVNTAIRIFTSLNIYPIKYLQDLNKKFYMAELFDFNEFVPLFRNIYKFHHFDQNEEKYDKICFELEIEPTNYKNRIHIKQNNSREFIKTDSSTEFDVILFKEPILINSKDLIKHIICSNEMKEILKNYEKTIKENKGLAFKYKNINAYDEIKQYPFESPIILNEISNELTLEKKEDYLLKDSFYGAKISNRYFNSISTNPQILDIEKSCNDIINFLAADKEKETQKSLKKISIIFKKQFQSKHEKIFKEIYDLSYFFINNKDKRPIKYDEDKFYDKFLKIYKKNKLYNYYKKNQINNLITNFNKIGSDLGNIFKKNVDKIKTYDKKTQKKFDQLKDKIETIKDDGKYDIANKIRNDQSITLANLPKKLKQQDFNDADFKKLSIINLRIYPYYTTFLLDDICKKIPFLLKMKTKSDPKEKENYHKELNFIKDILVEIEKHIKLIPIDNKKEYQTSIKIENSKIIIGDLIKKETEILNFFINSLTSYKNKNLNNPNINFEEIDHPNIAIMIKHMAMELKKNKKIYEHCVDDLRSMHRYYDKDNPIENLKLKSLTALNLFFENTKVEKINNIISTDKTEEEKKLSIIFWGAYNGFTKIKGETFKIALGSLELKDFFDTKNQQNMNHQKKSKTEIKNDNKDKNKSKLKKDSHDTKNKQTNIFPNAIDSPKLNKAFHINNEIDVINNELDFNRELMNEEKKSMEIIKKSDGKFKTNNKYISHEKNHKQYMKKIDELIKQKDLLEKTKK